MQAEVIENSSALRTVQLPPKAQEGDTAGADPISSGDGLTIDAVQKIITEGGELPPG
jgi:hypothetical protein